MEGFDILLHDDGTLTLRSVCDLDEVPADFYLNEAKQRTLLAALEAAKLLQAEGGADEARIEGLKCEPLEVFSSEAGLQIAQEGIGETERILVPWVQLGAFVTMVANARKMERLPPEGE